MKLLCHLQLNWVLLATISAAVAAPAAAYLNSVFSPLPRLMVLAKCDLHHAMPCRVRAADANRMPKAVAAPV